MTDPICNPFPNKPWFLRVCSTSLKKKHFGKRRNCSLRSISPFSTVFSTGFENFLPFSSILELFGRVKICRLGKGWKKKSKSISTLDIDSEVTTAKTVVQLDF